MRFSVTVKYVPGKHQLKADALSRAPIESPREKDEQFVDELESFAAQTVFTRPATTQRLSQIREAQTTDEECAQIRNYLQSRMASLYATPAPATSLLGKKEPFQRC